MKQDEKIKQEVLNWYAGKLGYGNWKEMYKYPHANWEIEDLHIGELVNKTISKARQSERDNYQVNNTKQVENMIELVKRAKKGDTLYWNERLGVQVNLDEIKREARTTAISEVRELIEKTIQKIGKQRDEDDYSTLDKGHPNCPEGCGDEGLYHQEQILKELLVEFNKKFGKVKP